MIPNVLTIAGTDPSGGAGIQADIKAFSAMGAYAMSVVTAVVAQNTMGVRSFVALDASFVGEQIDAVFEDVRVDAVKIGMVATEAVARVIAERLRHHGAANIVLDPVMVASSGHDLQKSGTINAIRVSLVPLSTLITPNLTEAGLLLDTAPPSTLADMRACIGQLTALGPRWVLLKGGHLQDGDASIDLLRGAGETIEFPAPRIHTRNDHGTGCTLSAAIAALLPSHGMEESVGIAKAYLNGALAASGELNVGRGRGPLHHFHQLWRHPDLPTRPQ